MNLYESIEKSIREHEESLHVANEVTEVEVRYAIRWVMRDNPDIFWFYNQYHFNQDEKTISFNYQFSQKSSERIQERINEIVIYGFRLPYVKSLSVYEQVVSVYKWLLCNCHFLKETETDQNIYDFFLHGASDSIGYAKTAQYLFKLLGIESRLVYGKFVKNKYREHCWNIVYIEGNPYHIDICLGNVAVEKVLKKSGVRDILRFGDLNYNFFCVSTQCIEKVLRIDDIESHPICTKDIDWEMVETLSHIHVNTPVCAPKPSVFNNTKKGVENILGVALIPFTLVGKGVLWVKDVVTDFFADSDFLADAIDDLAENFDDSIILSSILPVVAAVVRNNNEIEGNLSNAKDVLVENKSLNNVYSSIFAPAEMKQKSHMLVQVYLHLYEETEEVNTLAQESDKNAERRDYIPLQCKLKKGDKVDVQLNIYGETLLMSDKKSVVWQGAFTKCSFDYFVPKDIDVDELSCVAMLTVNGVPVGEMRFITRIVDAPRQLNPEIIAHKYNKVFISYSHQDESKVKFLHEGLELGSVPHFFDRKYLKAGDVFPQVIQDYINSADLFILCWSENASKSEYVQKERMQALERAFPQVKPEQEAKLRIYPMSIEPRAELPTDMKENYHFGEM